MKLKLEALSLTILTFCALTLAGNERGYGFLMLEEPLSAKSIGMGGVGTALAGTGFRYYNPVQPFFSSHPYVSAEFGQMPGGVNKGGVESALIFPKWFTALSFYSSSLDFETRDERGFGSSASSSTTIGGLSGGFIRGRLAVGISVNAVQDRIWVSSAYNAVSLSGGLGYTLIDGKLNLGAAGFHGIAKSSGFGDSASVWHDGRVPRFARAGGAWMDTLKTFPFTIAADVVYRDENKTFSVPVGAEVQPLPYIALRIGKRFGWESEILSLGIGFNIDQVAFDAAFVPSVIVDDYELKWSMGLTYNLGGKRKAKSDAGRAISFDPIRVSPSTDDNDAQAAVIEVEQQLQEEEPDLDEQERIIIDEDTEHQEAEVPLKEDALSPDSEAEVIESQADEG